MPYRYGNGDKDEGCHAVKEWGSLSPDQTADAIHL
jgi:hypothetical protein